MLIVSRDMGSRPFGVIFTARRAVFICGDTEVMVPWRMVPKSYIISRSEHTAEDGVFTILELDRDGLVGAFHKKSSTRSALVHMASLDMRNSAS